MLRYTGMCRPNGLFFHKKSLDMGPIFVKKNKKGWSHFLKIAGKKIKISRFEGEKSLEIGPDFQKFRKCIHSLVSQTIPRKVGTPQIESAQPLQVVRT